MRHDLLLEALGYAQRLVDILPSPESQTRVAAIWAELGEPARALQVLQAVQSGGYATRQILLEQGRLLMRVGRAREAAEMLEKASSQYPNDYDIKLLCGTAWARAHEHDRAIAMWEPLIDAPRTGVELLISLGGEYFLKDASDPNTASKAFHLYKRAFEIDRNEPTLPARLLLAAEASGRTREAWDLIGTLDLSENPYLRAVPQDKAIPMVKEMMEGLRQRTIHYEAGMIPFDIYARHTPRSAWYLWLSRIGDFNDQWKRGNPTIQPLLVALPSMRTMLQDLQLPRAGLLLDMTAILTIGSLGVTREILEVLSAISCPIVLFPGCSSWLNDEVVRLQADQLPWYRRRYHEVEELLVTARWGVDIRRTPHPDPGHLPEKVREAFGPLSYDIEEACAAAAYYLDDYVEPEQARELGSGVLISSPQALRCLVQKGLILAEDAHTVQSTHPKPFSGAGETPVLLDRPVVFSEQALLSWHEAGLLRKWVQGGEGWPRIIVGPFAWASLTNSVRESLFYRESLERATATRLAIDEFMLLERVREAKPAERNILESGALAEIWGHGLTMLGIAEEHNLAIWADDLFFHLITDPRGLLSDDAGFRRLEQQIRGAFPRAAVVGTEGILDWLSKDGALARDRSAQLIWELFSKGYRVLTLSGVFDWWLNRVPFKSDQLAVPYERLLADLEGAARWLPQSVELRRRQSFIQTTLVAILVGLVNEVWAVSSSTFLERDRRILADRLLRIFERITE